MNRFSTAAWVALFASAAHAGLAAADPPGSTPASRPANELALVVVGNTVYNPDPGTPMDVYGTSSLPIAAAPLAASHLESVRVEDYLKAIQARVPRFRYIIRRDNVDQDCHPVLPTMDTSSLTLGEFVNFVNQNCPGVRIEPDTSVSPVDPLYVVTLAKPPQPADAPTAAPAPAADPPVVRTFSLSGAIGVQRLAHKENEVRALDDVLSLIQAVVDASPDGRSAKLKVHAPTGMLIFIGPDTLGQAVAGTLNTLERNGQGGLNNMVNDALRQSSKLQQKLDDLEADNAKLRESAAATTRPAAK